MQFTELSEEQMNAMQFATTKTRSGKNPYGDLLEAVKGGKKVLVNLEAGKQMRNLKWGITQAAKHAKMKIDIKVLADQSGVVVSLSPEGSTPPSTEGEDTSEASTTGTRSRKSS